MSRLSPRAPKPSSNPEPLEELEQAEQRERLLFHFVREAPRLANASHLGVSSAPVEPWPHQLEVVRRSVEAFPRGFLFCDEVGLGKTIEAALTLRQLLLSGRVSRVLILVPKALLHQWQEELHEKAALEVPLYDGRRCLAADGSEVRLGGLLPWELFPVLLASSQLFRRRKRHEELLRAKPWDLVIVDEAHHARRSRGGRPNRLLELLAGSKGERGGLKERTRCLYLLTATPMQVDPVELWDLLRLIGLGGAWGAREDDFLRYFAELRRPAAERDLPFLATLLRDSLETAALFPELDEEIRGQLAEVPAYVTDFVEAARRGAPVQPRLARAEQERLDAWLRALTPLRFLIWRSTRRVLRAYQAAGRLDALLPERQPTNLWIALRPAELELYRRIDDYLARHYLRFEAKRPGLGFVMTLYRRRLTSSFYAVQRSLERRRAFLLGEVAAETLFDEVEDEEAEDAELDAAPAQGEEGLFAVGESDEKAELASILAELAKKRRDTKLEQLKKDLAAMLGSGRFDRALVFTQYLDTLDFLRQALDKEWRVATYSGRGGEVAREGIFLPCAKEDLKEAFARGEIELLICTDAASEGLNLQSCGFLINYDMPWNPMRVEQRIGRIDRLGQVHPQIVVHNYFYSDTVEAEIYRRLADRIGFFQEIVGPLQPILHRLGETVKRLAMVPAAQRQRPLEEDLDALEKSFAEIGPDPLDIGRGMSPPVDPPAPPVSAVELEKLFLASQAFGPLLTPDDELPGAYLLSWRGERKRVTFRKELFARYPYRLRLLTWGQRLFAELVASVPPPEAGEEPGGLGYYSCRNPFTVGLFQAAEGPVENLSHLTVLSEGNTGSWSARQESEAATHFSRVRRRVLQGLEKVEAGRRKAERQALLGAARQLLAESAITTLARAQNPGIFDAPLPYGFGTGAVAAQAQRGEAFALLVQKVTEAGELPAAQAENPLFLRLAGQKPSTLEKRRQKNEEAAEELASAWQSLLRAEEEAGLWARDPSEGLLERAYFLAPRQPVHEEGVFLAPAKAFDGAVPFYEDLAAAGRRFLDAVAEGVDPQGEEKARPEHFTWLALAGRYRATPGLFAADLPGGGRALFRLGARPPRPGLLLLAFTAESGCLLATLEKDKKARRPMLRSAEDPSQQWLVREEGDLVVLAYLLEYLA